MADREIVNDCYILQGGLGTDACCDLVEASAMFAATRFLLRFFRPGIPPEAVEAFRARVVDSYNVRHRAIVDAIEVDRSGKRLFVSSEYGGQKTLRAVLGEATGFPLELVCGFVLELAQGLDAFHAHGLAYGTLDADSVWAARDAGEVIELRFLKPGYLDFVPWYGRDDAGTLERFAYLAPEVKGLAPYELGPWSDVYSLGVHLYRFITGLLPFRRQSVERALNKSVSVLHVARALARRGVPEQLVRIAVRCVRRNPKLRYRSCVELVSDLKEVLASLARASEAAGIPDPGRSIAYLNRERERLGAAQYARTLETAEYFRTIVAGGPSVASGGSARFPARFPTGTDDPEGSAEIEELEALEADGEEDDDRLDDGRIAADSVRAIELERASREGKVVRSAAATGTRFVEEAVEREVRVDLPAAPAAPPISRGEESAARLSADVPAGAVVRGHAAASGGGAAVNAGRIATAPSEVAPLRGGRAAGETRRRASGPSTPDHAAIRWRAERVRLDAAASRLLDGFGAARQGRGSFSFVERPDDARALAVLRHALALMEEGGFLADAGSCAAGLAAVCARVVAALRAAVESRPRRERRRLASRCDAFEVLLPLPDAMETTGDSDDAKVRFEAAARALAGFGTRSRPLVLVVGDSERADRSLHALFLALAGAARRSAFYGIAFHGDAQAPDWHALAGGRTSREA